MCAQHPALPAPCLSQGFIHIAPIPGSLETTVLATEGPLPGCAPDGEAAAVTACHSSFLGAWGAPAGSKCLPCPALPNKPPRHQPNTHPFQVLLGAEGPPMALLCPTHPVTHAALEVATTSEEPAVSSASRATPLWRTETHTALSRRTAPGPASMWSQGPHCGLIARCADQTQQRTYRS